MLLWENYFVSALGLDTVRRNHKLLWDTAKRLRPWPLASLKTAHGPTAPRPSPLALDHYLLPPNPRTHHPSLYTATSSALWFSLWLSALAPLPHTHGPTQPETPKDPPQIPHRPPTEPLSTPPPSLHFPCTPHTPSTTPTYHLRTPYTLLKHRPATATPGSTHPPPPPR